MEKMRIVIKRTAMLLLAGVLCVLLFLPVFSADASGTTGSVKNRVLNVRKEASTSSSIVCKLSQGTKVSVVSETTGTDGMKWYRVSFTYSGSTYKGYVRADLLNVTGTSSGSSTSSTSGTSSTAGADVLYVSQASVRVRASASTGAAIVTGLVRDSAVDVRGTRTGTDGRQWTKVSFNKDGQRLHGYIRSDLLTASKPASVPNASSAGNTVNTGNNTSGNSGSATQDGDILCVNVTAVRVRDGASESCGIVANLMKGDEVKQKKVKTGADGKQWTKVSFTLNGTKYQGYIRSDYLTKKSSSSDGSSSGTSVSGEDGSIRYITASALRVRSSASTSSEVVANLLKGDKVEFRKEKTGEDGKKWTKISFTINGTRYHGYVHSENLSKSKPSSDGNQNSSSNNNSSSSNNNSGSSTNYRVGTVTRSVINMRQSASTSSGVVAKLVQGSRVTIQSETTGSDGRTWYSVSCVYNGTTMTGYIRSDLLTL